MTLPRGNILSSRSVPIGHLPIGIACHDADMANDVYKIRLARLKDLLMERFGGRKTELAEALGKSDNYISRVFNAHSAQHKRIGEDLAREIETALKLPRLWLDGEEGQVNEPTTFYGLAVSRDGVQFAQEWEKLREPLRTQIMRMVETLVAEQVRADRKSTPKRPEAEQPSIRVRSGRATS